MGSSSSKSLEDCTKEDIALGVSALGQTYEAYCDAMLVNGINGKLLNTLDAKELEESMDDLNITNRLHRRVLMLELQRAKRSSQKIQNNGPTATTTPCPNCDDVVMSLLTALHVALANINECQKPCVVELKPQLPYDDIVTHMIRYEEQRHVPTANINSNSKTSHFSTINKVPQYDPCEGLEAYESFDDDSEEEEEEKDESCCSDRDAILRHVSKQIKYQQRLGKQLLARKNSLQSCLLLFSPRTICHYNPPTDRTCTKRLSLCGC